MALKIKYHFNGKPRLINFANDKYHDIYEFLVQSGIKQRLAAMTFGQVGLKPL